MTGVGVPLRMRAVGLRDGVKEMQSSESPSGTSARLSLPAAARCVQRVHWVLPDVARFFP
jgi:hypothetical protein